jgi:putative ABC transport system permease protein
LGIGANAAIFSVVDGVLLRELPFPEADRLVEVASTEVGGAKGPAGDGSFPASPPDFYDWRAQSTQGELAAYDRVSFNFRGSDVPERLQGARVSANLFRVLRVSPIIGRGLSAEEELRDRGRVAVLSYDLWQQSFGGAPSAIGKTIRLDAADYTVIGVMPAGFDFPIRTQRVQLWVPMTLPGDSAFQANRGAHSIGVVGRLQPGATVESLRNEVAAIAKRLAEQFPATNAQFSATARPLREALVGESRLALFVLAGAVGFLLLIACANVANLMLARATMRTKEVAIRTAVGASREDIVRQLLTESVILGLAGGALGLLLATWGTEVLVAAAPTALPRVHEIAVDWRVLAFTLGVSVLTGILFGLAPALHVVRDDLYATLKEGGRTSTGSGATHRVRSALVVGEVALSLVLLSGAGLLGTTLLRLQQVAPGFELANMLTAQVALPDGKYQQNAQVVAFYDRLLERVQALPGVEAAGAVSSLPLAGQNIGSAFNLEGEVVPEGGAAFLHSVDVDVVTPNYFRAAGMELKTGRGLTAQDDTASPYVIVINEAMARRYWPGQSPIGKRVSVGFFTDSLREVVGVVGDVRRSALDTPPGPAMYVPVHQNTLGSLFLAVRTRGNPSSLAPALRREVAALDPDLALSLVRPMEEVLSASITQRRFSTFLLTLFAGVALALSAVGIYGVMTSMVAQRTREIAVRMALGAKPRDVLRMIVGHGAALTLAGVVVGVAGALALARLLTGLLYGVEAGDPLTLVAVSLLLGGVALVASYVPARRATRVDPMEALRAE